jgi:hypothetical protein
LSWVHLSLALSGNSVKPVYVQASAAAWAQADKKLSETVTLFS